MVAFELFAHALKHFTGVIWESPNVLPNEVLQPLCAHVGKRVAAEPLIVDGRALAATVVVIAFPRARVRCSSSPIGPPAMRAFDESREEIVALAPSSSVALVLL